MVIKWIKSNILDLIQSVGMVGVAVVAIVAWLQSVPWYLALLGLLTAVVLILGGINQYEIRKERHKKKLTQLSDKELESLIWDWLKISAWKANPQPLQVETVFAYQVQFQDILIDVVKEKPQPEMIFLVSVFTMPSEKEGLSEVERNRLWGQLRIEFARLGIQWDYVGTPDTVKLSEPIILDDSITPYYFRSRIMFVVRANILAYELWKEALRLSRQSIPDKEDSQTE